MAHATRCVQRPGATAQASPFQRRCASAHRQPPPATQERQHQQKSLHWLRSRLRRLGQGGVATPLHTHPNCARTAAFPQRPRPPKSPPGACTRDLARHARPPSLPSAIPRLPPPPHLVARLDGCRVREDGNVGVKLPRGLRLEPLVHQDHALAHLLGFRVWGGGGGGGLVVEMVGGGWVGGGLVVGGGGRGGGGGHSNKDGAGLR